LGLGCNWLLLGCLLLLLHLLGLKGLLADDLLGLEVLVLELNLMLELSLESSLDVLIQILLVHLLLEVQHLLL